MIDCPNCQTSNRAGAKFCKSCASPLPAVSLATRPLNEEELNIHQTSKPQSPHNLDQPTVRTVQSKRTDTQPLQGQKNLTRRPPGAVFGDAFLYDNVIYSDESQNRYLVIQFDAPVAHQIRLCPNQDCGALFPPRNSAPEKYCTDCGTVLEMGLRDLILIETFSPLPDNIFQLVEKGLSHGSVRAPLLAFTERLAGSQRHCLVVSQVGAMDHKPDSLQALKWGMDLSRGLDYLHDNGITFDGYLENDCFGLVDGRAVWAGYTGCSHLVEGYVSDRQVDVRALVHVLFNWLTGRSHYERDPNLSPGVNHAFEQAMAVPGPATGLELAQIFEQALEEVSAPQAFDYQLGRRTHVGMVRDLNEDSLLTLEINRIQQSYSQPMGVYAVADGMGGHAAGEIASGTIVNVFAQKALAELLPAQVNQNDGHDFLEWLRGTVEAANGEVLSLRKTAGTDMGSTLVAMVLEGRNAYITHVGDSRAYLVNTNGIRRLTTDHSLVERLIATNQITREEARVHPQRNVIYRTIGDKPKVEVDVSTQTLAAGDYILLCSDGLSGMLEDEMIHRIVLDAPSSQAACDGLINAANIAGGDDNIAVVVVKVVQL